MARTATDTPDTAEETEEMVSEPVLVTVEDVAKLMSESTDPRLQEQLAQSIVNPIVLAKMLGVKPQQIYNRIRAGKIATVTQNSTQKIVIPIAEAQRFAANYMDRKARSQAKLEAELAGE
jgi:hypothetical protein